MSRLKLLILAEVICLAVVAGVLWFLYGPSQTPTAAVIERGASASAGDGTLKGAGQKYPVPSGLEVTVWDRFEEEDGTVRFRFLAPGIAQGSQGEEAASDMQVLCDTYVLENLPDPAHPPQQVIVTLMEKPIELGDSRPDVVQFFEAFTFEDGKCVWEMF